MAVYADVSDLVCEVPDADVAEKLIERASRKIDRACGGAPTDPGIANDVCCAMVERALAPYAGNVIGVTQASMTAGSYQQQWTYANPGGDLYLTKDEKRMLGCYGGKLGVAIPSYGRLEPDDD